MDRIEELPHVYTKGDRDYVVKRCDSVHTITINCPLSDMGIKILRTNLVTVLSSYLDDDKLRCVPVLDVFNVFMETLKTCKSEHIPFENLYSLWGAIQTFKNLHYVNFNFTDDDELLEAYEFIRDSKSNVNGCLEMIKRICTVDEIELVLSNLFDQDVIDMINKSLMFNGIIENSYMDREFLIMFEFDDYISYMNMFCENNAMRLSDMDTYIIDFLLLFPKIISDDKPTIRILTNYPDL